MMANLRLAKAMLYRYQYEENCDPGVIQDILDGQHYRSLLESFVMVVGKQLPFLHFSDFWDVALGLSTDGVAIFKKRSKTSWPLGIFNYNLPPDIRFLKENLIPIGVIPGPKKPSNMDSSYTPSSKNFCN